MLEPLRRRHLLEALRPPDGYDVDVAVGTTYSLDLMTLLTVPLSFALSDWEDDGGRTQPDPMALLEAIRRYADRTHIFCQAGGIYLPKGNKLFLSHLEDVVHEVVAPKKGGVFHPKIWVLRFKPSDIAEPVAYRVLVLSRNLTFDRSWDTLLLLEGELRERARVIRQSAPLGDFVEALPGMMHQRPDRSLRTLIGRVADELRRVRLELPAGFKDLRFHPLGLPGTDDWWFEGRLQRMLTISPFLDPAILHDLGSKEDGDILVSRLDQLRRLPASALTFKDVYFMAPEADPDGEDDGQDSKDDADSEVEALSGLHAKLYVADDGWNGRVWTGSANATTAAFSHNVEFLVELVGKKSFCGVSAMMERAKTKADARFADLLSRYVPDESESPEVPADVEMDRLKQQLRVVLAQASIQGDVVGSEDAKRFDVTLKLEKRLRLPKGVEVRLKVWPVTLHESAAQELILKEKSETRFAELSFEALTSFFGLEVRVNFGKKSFSDRFVLNVPLAGMPADRQDRILRALLNNRQRVLQFLLFLLAEDDNHLLSGHGRPGGDGETDAITGMFGGASLLEPLVHALYEDPDRIDRVAKLVNDLTRTEEGRGLLPEGFMQVWEPVWSAREELKS